MTRRTRGFTLIELLVVIAIIAILAAMLFPVFARACESARKIQCLSNVKNIAIAVQIYLSDYDRFPPYSADPQLLTFLDSRSSTGDGCYNGENRVQGANPFLRWPVILDEYVKNRNVWQCPSIVNVGTARWIVPDYTPVWWQYLAQNNSAWGSGGSTCGGGPCCQGWPSGWGGTITDSMVQGAAGMDTGSFQISIGTNDTCLIGRKTSELDDPSAWVVCGDNNQGAVLNQMFGMAYGDPKCCWDLGTGPNSSGSDPSNASTACKQFYTDPGSRKKYAPHLGGLNLGFADGHAAWWDAEAAVTEAGWCACCKLTTNCAHSYGFPHNQLHGLCPDYQVTSFVH